MLRRRDLLAAPSSASFVATTEGVIARPFASPLISMLDRGSASALAYAQIKQWLMDGEFPTGPLDIRRLGDQLRISATPVREALARLSAERLVSFTPLHGYAFVPPSGEDLRNLYLLTSAITDLALNQLLARPSRNVIVRSSLSPKEPCYALLLSSTFNDIASAQSNDELTWQLRQLNDRLALARTCEPQALIDAPVEARTLSDLWCAGDYGALLPALDEHFRVRIAAADTVARLIAQRTT